jgi:hypothetical protein
VANKSRISEVNSLFLSSEIIRSLTVIFAWGCWMSGAGLPLHYTAQLILTPGEHKEVIENKQTFA